MGTPGVAWDVPKVQIVEALKRNKGRLIATAQELDCCFDTIQKYIKKDPDLIELLASLRRGAGHRRVDQAEGILEKAMANADKDIRAALSAAFYTLNTDDMAKERGWGNKKDETQDKAEELSRFLELERANCELQIELHARRRALSTSETNHSQEGA